MTEEKLVFTKKVAKSGRGYLLWIPKDIVDYLDIDEASTVEVTIRKLSRKK